jgi:peptidoglycan/LPS O-acetylase OafA/YrhL
MGYVAVFVLFGGPALVLGFGVARLIPRLKALVVAVGGGGLIVALALYGSSRPSTGEHIPALEALFTAAWVVTWVLGVVLGRARSRSPRRSIPRE